ncbi:MAG: class I SAM-dependent methyltransferase [Acidiferrobacteraceae bacterium]
MSTEPQDKQAIATRTLAYYNEHADDFWAGTRDHDVRQNITALLAHIHGERPYTILDFGCGPGRDLKAFAELGHIAIGLDGAVCFAEMARAYSGCDVWCQEFSESTLPPGYFDGVFANASLFHVPTMNLPQVLRALHATLKPGGVLFSSNPHGTNEEGWHGARYGVYHDLESWQRFLCAAGFREITHYYRPTGRPKDQQPWLASLWRRIDVTR